MTRIGILIALFAVAVLVVTGDNQRFAAMSVAYETTAFSEQEWVAYARSWVAWHGMIGDPDREEWALMTLGSYLTLLGGENALALPRETPIFIYKAFGDIPELRGFGMASGGDQTIGFKLEFNAQTGQILFSSAYTQESLARAGELDLSFIPADSGGSRAVSEPLPTLAVLPSARLTLPEATPEMNR